MGTVEHSFQKDLEALQSGGGKGIPGGEEYGGETATEVSVDRGEGMEEEVEERESVCIPGISQANGGEEY